jgi:hypothetical protein
LSAWAPTPSRSCSTCTDGAGHHRHRPARPGAAGVVGNTEAGAGSPRRCGARCGVALVGSKARWLDEKRWSPATMASRREMPMYRTSSSTSRSSARSLGRARAGGARCRGTDRDRIPGLCRRDRRRERRRRWTRSSGTRTPRRWRARLVRANATCVGSAIDTRNTWRSDAKAPSTPLSAPTSGRRKMRSSGTRASTSYASSHRIKRQAGMKTPGSR